MHAPKQSAGDSPQVLPPAYTPTDHERLIYKLWEDAGYFRATIDPDKEPYSIAMPPPNITAPLHLGHIMGNAIQDSLIRFERMRGKSVLYVPGSDHAGIATQVVVEQKLAKEQGKTRHDLGREKFLEEVRAFVDATKARIHEQVRRAGVSADWSRERYTFDEHMSRAVNEAFVRMYEDGLIYRGQRIVHWDAALKSTVSDEELEYETEQAPLYTLQYGPFKITTARPETKFGDKYVVVHPGDKRYAKYKDGETFTAEWINGPVTATIIKDKAIDPKFGTGVMTITPWHDAVDFEIAERHDLEREQIIGYDGKLLPVAGEFAGMNISEARPKIVAKLKAKGLLVSTDDKYSHNIAVNSRGGAIIEPQIMKQWFVKVAPLAKKAIKAVKSKKIAIVPAQFEKTYFNWMENIHDWNISRQLWWGHRIPVFTCSKCTHEFAAVEQPKNCPTCKTTANDGAITQDPDTLDTWFSSGLWTFATLGWPDKTRDLEYWHPTAVMETGRDILFFWVARMIMMSLYFTKEVPFKTVYLHGLVLDKNGKKMSKSKGNGIDPIDMADKFGMDALRLSLMLGISPGLDTRLSEEKIARQRNVINKLWNISRFVLTTTKCERTCERLSDIKLEQLALEDQWILHRLDQLTASVTKSFEELRFSDAIGASIDFLWNDFADWYLEVAKLKPSPAKNDILLATLEQLLTLLHPFVPFVTEVLWQELKKSDPEAAKRPDLIVAPWPSSNKAMRNSKSAKAFAELQEFVSGVRMLRADYHVPQPSVITVTTKESALFKQEQVMLQKLAKIKLIFAAKGSGLKRTIGSRLVFAEITEHVDLSKERTRMNKELTKLTTVVAGLNARLKSKTFLQKAPRAVIEQERIRQAELTKKINELQALVDEIGPQ